MLLCSRTVCCSAYMACRHIDISEAVKLRTYDPGLSELQLETGRKCEDARIQCTNSARHNNDGD